MIHVDVRTNVKSVQKNLGFLARKQLPKATSMALNKTATSLRGFTVREGKKAMGASNIKSKEVRAKTFILKANIRKLFAVLILRGGKYPLERFRAKQTSIGFTASAYGVNKVYKSSLIQTVRGKKNVFNFKTLKYLNNIYGIKRLYPSYNPHYCSNSFSIFALKS